MPTSLSVNINKVATLRNARGGQYPDPVQFAKDCERWGADGITVHPRPDERHITGEDVRKLAPVVTTEFNIEGYPDDRYLRIIEEIRPAQATLVPDPPDVLTSNTGWDCLKRGKELETYVSLIRNWGVRVSVFLNPDTEQVKAAAQTGTDRIELYTGDYARQYHTDRSLAVAPFREAAMEAEKQGLGLNAGHDLDMHNLGYFHREVPGLLEVSIGHALISDALYYGAENTIQLYKKQLK